MERQDTEGGSRGESTTDAPSDIVDFPSTTLHESMSSISPELEQFDTVFNKDANVFRSLCANPIPVAHSTHLILDPIDMCSIPPPKDRVSVTKATIIDSTLTWEQQQQQQLMDTLLSSSSSHRLVLHSFSQVSQRVSEPDCILQTSEMPDFLEPNLTFVISGSIRDKVVEISGLLSQNSVDFRFCEDGCAFSCFSYRDCYCLSFAVVIYSNGSERIVEFQRRCGDSIQFYRLFHRAKVCFSGQEQQPTSTREVELKLADPPSFGVPPSSNSMVRCLNEMANSKNTEQQFEGVRGLAHLSSKAENCCPMLDFGVLKIFAKCVASRFQGQIRRCAATGIANLLTEKQHNGQQGTEEPPGCVIEKHQTIPSLYDMILNINEIEAIREACRALVSITQADDTASLFSGNVVEFENVLEKLHDLDDEKVLEHLNKLVAFAHSQ